MTVAVCRFADDGVSRTAIMLPGTGSDGVFVRSVFEIPLAAAGLDLVAPRPDPGPSLADSALSALATLSGSSGPVVAGGISFGAHLAAEWAVAHPSRCAGLVLALPAWHGPPGAAPASRSALLSAAQVRSLGVDGALSGSRLPSWLHAELSRAWRGYGAGLAESLELAASRPAPELSDLSTLEVPVGIAACVDDPIHPAAVAEEWAAALPRAHVCTTRLPVVGADPEALGRAAVLAFLRAAGVA